MYVGPEDLELSNKFLLGLVFVNQSLKAITSLPDQQKHLLRLHLQLYD